VLLLEVTFDRRDEVLLDMQHAAAHLAHGMVVLAAGQLVVRGALLRGNVGFVRRSSSVI